MNIPPISIALACLEEEAKPYNVLQIGAYVGASANDPLWDIFSSGTLQHGTLCCIEPIPEYYDELVANYSSFPNVRCLNVAVSAENGMKPIFRLAVDPRKHGQPDWLEQISSLHAERYGKLWDQCEGRDPANDPAREFYRKHLAADLIQTVDYQTTMKLAGFESVDLVIIDAEGSEREILPQIYLRPRFLCYESVLLDPKPAIPAGYKAIQYEQDTFVARQDDADFWDTHQLVSELLLSNSLREP